MSVVMLLVTRLAQRLGPREQPLGSVSIKRVVQSHWGCWPLGR